MTVGYLRLIRHSLTFRELRLLGLNGHSSFPVPAIHERPLSSKSSESFVPIAAGRTRAHSKAGFVIKGAPRVVHIQGQVLDVADMR
jgi:hypothetical protein